MAKDKMTWVEASIEVLKKNKAPLHYGDIAERIISQNLLNAGTAKLTATPDRSVNAKITTSIKNEGGGITICPCCYWGVHVTRTAR